MKLKNKRTGEIVDLTEGFIRDTYNGSMIQIKPVAISNKEGYVYGSLAELNDEWEDYEEPKDTNYWCINSFGKIEFHSTVLDEIDGTPNNTMIRKIIGNYFDTREEAGQAVEKLKAWKRLKDKGFRFIGLGRDRNGTEDIKYEIELPPGLEGLGEIQDLNTCFGGEE